MLTYCAINNTNICHAGRDTTAATQGSTIYRMVKPAKLLPHTAHSDWINRTGLTSWAFTDKVAHYSSYRPRKDERLSRPGWLVTYRNKVPFPGVEPGHVTHPSTNRARRRVTSLIRPTPLPLRHAANNFFRNRVTLTFWPVGQTGQCMPSDCYIVYMYQVWCW